MELTTGDLPEELKVGDVVFLNSEPDILMVVSGVGTTEDPDYYCVWFDADKRINSIGFSRKMITKAII